MKAARQPNAPESQLPNGTPSTDAIDHPRNVNAIARPRVSAGAIIAAVAAPCGVEIAAEITGAMRRLSNCGKFAASAEATSPAAYQTRASVSNNLRSNRD